MEGRPAMTTTTQTRAERYDEEQEAFGHEVQRFLSDRQPIGRVRELAEDAKGRDADLWRRSAKELDILGLMVPEEYGGTGFGFVEVSLVLTAAGRALTSWPFLSSAVLATHCLLESGDADAMKRWLPGLAAGETVATVALADEIGSWAFDNGSVQATQRGDGSWTLSGTKSFVTDGQLADLVLVFATHERRTWLFAVETSDPGVRRTSLPVLDATRKLSRFAFDEVAAQPVGASEVTTEKHGALLAVAAAALACEATGGIKAAVEITTDYAKQRRQFGRTIGSFQSVKHRCAEMYMRSEASAAFAESVAFAVGEATREGSMPKPATQVDAATAALYCSDAFIRSAHDMIQVLGGIGFTWEHDAHLYLRRAASCAKLFGGKKHQMAVLTRAISEGRLLTRDGGGPTDDRGLKG